MAGGYVTGEDKLRSDLRGMGAAARNLEPVLERQARRTAEAITGVADRTGRLAREVKAERNRTVTGTSFEIGVGTFYGHRFSAARAATRRKPRKFRATSGARPPA